jgi:hypothetical protein
MSQAVNLWKDNRIDRAYTATLDELGERFAASEWADPERHPQSFDYRVGLWLTYGESAVCAESDQRLVEGACWDAVHP